MAALRRPRHRQPDAWTSTPRSCPPPTAAPSPSSICSSSAGRVIPSAPRRRLVIEEPIRVGDETAGSSRAGGFVPHQLHARQQPSDHRAAGRVLRDQRRGLCEELAAARTYGFLRDVPPCGRTAWPAGARSRTRSWSASASVLNDSLRFPDEFVRHKILDLVGDLSLLGRAVVGARRGPQCGHTLNHQLVLAIQKALRGRAPPRRGRMPAMQFARGDGLVPGLPAVERRFLPRVRSRPRLQAAAPVEASSMSRSIRPVRRPGRREHACPQGPTL